MVRRSSDTRKRDGPVSGGAPESTKIIDTIYDAIATPELWDELLLTLAQSVRASRVAFSIAHHSGPESGLINFIGFDNANKAARFLTELEEEDANTGFMAPGNGFKFVAMSDPKSEVRSNNPLVHYQFSRLQCAAVLENGTDNTCAAKTATSLLAFGRQKGEMPFAERDLHALNIYFPHLKRAARLSNSLSQVSFGSTVANRVIDHLPFGVFITREDGSIIQTNQAAKDILAQTDGIWLVAGRLRAKVCDGNDLATYLGSAPKVRSGNAEPDEPEILAIARPSHRSSYFCAIWDLDNTGLAAAPGNGRSRVYAIVVSDSEQSINLAPQSLADLLGLTKAEARVVVGLTNGKRLGELARQFGVSQTTVRSQLKVAFQKTGIHRQAELVKLVLSCPTSLGRPAKRPATPLRRQ